MNPKSNFRFIDLFAGIGGFHCAISTLGGKCVFVSEINNLCQKTYIHNFPSCEKHIFGDIKQINPKDIPEFDMLCAGFPCQSFSKAGKRKGFEDETRGDLFSYTLKILKEHKECKYVLLENVKNLKTHDKGRTYKRIKSELENLEYKVFTDIFNTAQFHLPQTRNRVIIFATTENVPNNFSENFTSSKIADFYDKNYQKLSPYYYQNVNDILSLDAPQKYFLSEKIKPTLLADGSANFKSKSDINMSIARPLTATMYKMHRACQDNYYSKDFIDSHGAVNPVNTLTKEELALLPIRRLTPEEAFMLQGFPASFAIKGREAGVADGSLYKQAGNAVSVNTIYAVLYFLIKNKILRD